MLLGDCSSDVFDWQAGVRGAGAAREVPLDGAACVAPVEMVALLAAVLLGAGRAAATATALGWLAGLAGAATVSPGATLGVGAASAGGRCR